MTQPSAMDEIKALVEAMDRRKSEVFEGLLKEVSVALGDIVSLMERPEEEDDDSAIVNALIEGLRGLQIKAPDVQVTVPQPVVNVAAPNVVVQAPSSPPTGWVMTVTSYDGNNNIRTVSIKPEN